MHRSAPLFSAAFLIASLAVPAAAQSNSAPGTDIRLAPLGGLNTWGRSGAFPNGVSGFSMSTTACNVGTVSVGWFAPMQTDHPTIAFMFVREENGRLVQISDRSYVKHGFFATNTSSCGACPNPGGDPTHLLPGCSDTYGTGNNGDNYYLGPPDEIDPWLGKWTATCSHFDRGEPAVNPPFDCDGNRSLTSSQANQIGPVNHRVVVADSELDHPAGTFWYQAQYMVNGEPEANRANNLGTRGFTPAWNGNAWSLGTTASFVQNTVVDRIPGATVASNTNGTSDGRIYVAVVVTGPDANNLYHYEYAVYNRDNRRGVGAVRIPVNPAAQVLNEGFRDIDGNTATDWTFVRTPSEISFSTSNNPLLWNSLYNIWFDSDAAPSDQTLTLDQFNSGSGLGSVTMINKAPMDLCGGGTTYCTAKVNSLGCTPSISTTGIASASAGSGFFVDASSVLNNKSGLFFYGLGGQQAVAFQGGFLCVNLPVQRTGVQDSLGNPPPNDCSGTYSLDFNAYIASGQDPFLIPGQAVDGQYWARDPGFAPPDNTSLSAGIHFTICP